MDFQLPPDEDSPDLTDEEVAGALVASNEDQFCELVVGQGKDLSATRVRRYELRRRKPALYCRVLFAFEGEPDKVLVIRMDWLKGL